MIAQRMGWGAVRGARKKPSKRSLLDCDEFRRKEKVCRGRCRARFGASGKEIVALEGNGEVAHD